MSTPVLTDCTAVKDYINGRIRAAYEAAGRPSDFSFDIEAVGPVDGDPFTVEIITRAGTEKLATRLALVGCLQIEGPVH